MDEELAHRFPVEHSVESRDLIYSHRGHLQNASNLIHHADTAIPVLSLTQIKQRQDGGFLVLGRIPRDDLFDEGEVCVIEFEGDFRIVELSVPMLPVVSLV